MRTAGIVCEYNPFHKGHRYHLERTRELGATHIVCVMSGSFVQRGEPACVDKAVRARMAVENGADLVVELPLPWAVSSAEGFARGAVGVLRGLGCVDMLSFGSECDSVESIVSCARAVDSEAVQSKIARLMSSGCTYPVAVRRAVGELCSEEVFGCLDRPNDTLNVEYIRAISATKSKMEPVSVKRLGAHDGSGESALSIRQALLHGKSVAGLMPDSSYRLLNEALEKGFAPCSLSYVERAVLSKLRLMTPQDIKKAPDVAQGLENRIYKAVRQATSLSELFALLKTKRYTLARLRRIVLSLYLGVPGDYCRQAPPYIRLLAANSRGLQVLAESKNASLPIISRFSDIDKLSDFGKSVFELECRAGDLYALCSPTVKPCGEEMRLQFYRAD